MVRETPELLRMGNQCETCIVLPHSAAQYIDVSWQAAKDIEKNVFLHSVTLTFPFVTNTNEILLNTSDPPYMTRLPINQSKSVSLRAFSDN